MRAFLFLAGAALTLAACGSNGEAENSMNADQALSAETIVANDVTAIDAITADAANMAADVDINFTEAQPLSNGSNTAAPSRPSRPSTSGPASPQSNTVSPTPPATPPASNATANAVE